MVSGEPTTNERENLYKFIAPNNNINLMLPWQVGELTSKVKRQGDLGHLKRIKII